MKTGGGRENSARGRSGRAGCCVLVLAALLSACASAPDRRKAALEWYEVGNAWYALGDWAKAGAAYSRALNLDKNLDAASYNAARALAEAGDFGQALALLDPLLERSPDNVRVIATKAYILYKMGRAVEALQAYDRVLELDPFAPDALYNAALLRLSMEDAVGAAGLLAPLVDAKPDDTAALALYAKALAAAERGPEAIAAYEALRGRGKADGAALETLGLLYEKEREFAKAMEALEAAVKAESSRAGAWFALARLRLSQAEDGQGGLEALKHALEGGFSDRDAAAALLAEPVLAEREAVLEALKDKGLVE